MSNALQVCYYPIRFPLAGGQIRSTETRKLIAALGYEPHFMGIFPHRTDGWGSDIPISKDADDWIFRLPYDFEMRLSAAVLSNRSLWNQIIRRATSLGPELLWMEHPFLWPVFRDWALQRRERLKIVYSSHNVEWKLKENLTARLGIYDKYATQRIYETERDLAFHSDVVVCCSDSDNEHYRAFGKRKVVVVPNGSRSPEPDTIPSEPQDESVNWSGNGAVITFVSSSHEPNWFGLRDLVLPLLKRASLFENATLILMGDICNLYEKWRVNEGQQFPNIYCAGRVSEDRKSSLFHSSDIVVLPIMDGGGTNLKTAEALLSSRLIVATDMAFRGFEQHRNLPGVFCGSPQDFPDLLARANSLRIELGHRSKLAQYCSQRHTRVKDCEWPDILNRSVPLLVPFLRNGGTSSTESA